MKRILILTGEKSGEIIAKPLVLEIRKQIEESICITGMTGDILSPYLDETIVNSNTFGVIGFVEALSKYRVLKKAQKKIFEKLKSSNFDLVVLVDFIGFNLTIGKFAKKMGVPVILYVGPQIWAWKKNRIKKLKKCLDFIGLILPFEEALYNKEPFHATYVGNPLIESLPRNFSKNEAVAKFSFIKKGDLVISFLPGSRDSEIKYHFLIICETIVKLYDQYSNAKFIISLAKISDISSTEVKLIDSLKQDGIPIYIQSGMTHDVILSSDVVGTASGTASLETALLKVPCVIFYKSSFSSYLIFKMFSLIKYVGLPNIIMGVEIVTELLQDNFNAKKLSNEIIKIIEVKNVAKNQIANFNRLEKKLGPSSASKAMASIIARVLSDSSL
ncbi:lipid-A-disaccharide synthase [Betaproteobacteria bacterium]|nr:lipid-A-disaccharide synthase [Betaproteobacteria bacterium]